MSVYEFEYADMSSEFSTDEWVYAKVVWVPMGVSDRAYICEHYNDEEFGLDYSKCTQWLVYITGPVGDMDDWSIVLMPCASDGSSGFDTPFLEIYDISKYDEVISQLHEDRCYK